MTTAPHFYQLENVFCFILPSVCGEAEHFWLLRPSTCWSGLSFWTTWARWKVHTLFPGCKRHEVKPVFDRSQRHSFDSDLSQKVSSGSDWISEGELLLAHPFTNPHSQQGGCGVRASVASLTLSRWCRKRELITQSTQISTQSGLLSSQGSSQNIL